MLGAIMGIIMDSFYVTFLVISAGGMIAAIVPFFRE